jgi:predicted transcriptional regulator YdeE
MVTLAEMDDPEIPDHRYLVFQVTARGSVEQLAAQNDEWHRRLCQLPGRIPGRYRLSILTE